MTGFEGVLVDLIAIGVGLNIVIMGWLAKQIRELKAETKGTHRDIKRYLRTLSRRLENEGIEVPHPDDIDVRINGGSD